MIKVRIREAQKKLRQIISQANKAAKFSIREAVKPIKDIIANSTPVKKAILKKGLGVKNLTKKEMRKRGIPTDAVAVKVGYVRKTRAAKLRKIQKKITLPALASILSSGARPHEIKAREKKVLGFGRTYTKKVNHPGVKGSSFFEKATSGSEQDIKSLFYINMKEYLEKNAN